MPPFHHAQPPRWRLVACAVTVMACVPYLLLKVCWLAGSRLGAAGPAAAAEMGDTRHLVGNVVTVGMDGAAILLVLALTFPWGRRPPAWLLVTPMWVAAGLLAPIALGLPIGLVVQAFVGGAPAPAGNGLQGWVYAVVYGGFTCQALGLLAAFLGHVRERWPSVLRPGGVERGQNGSLVRVAAAVAAGYAALNIVWALGGTAVGAPAGFVTGAQRSVLLATGLLIAVAAVQAASPQRLSPHPVTSALAWVGAGVAVMSGPAEIALANHARVDLVLVVAATLGVLSGAVLGLRLFSASTPSGAVWKLRSARQSRPVDSAPWLG